jgi:hypothetical protein
MAKKSTALNYEKATSKLYAKYSNSVYSVFLEERYGIEPCCETKPTEILEAELMLCEWKKLKGTDDLSDSQIRYFSNLPVYIDGKTGTSSNDSHYRYAASSSSKTARVVYNTGVNGNENIVEINAGGAVTRINLNPIINIDNTAVDKFVFTQEEPSTVCLIQHDLEFVPGNELITDLDGNEIDGITRVVNINTIQVEFSEPVAGYAYLS